MKGLAKSAAIGAALSSFFYLTVTWGLSVGFRVRDWIERRREASQAQERTLW